MDEFPDYNPRPRVKRGPRKDLNLSVYDRAPPVEPWPTALGPAWWARLWEQEAQPWRDWRVQWEKDRERRAWFKSAKRAQTFQIRAAKARKTGLALIGFLAMFAPAVAAFVFIRPGFYRWSDYAFLLVGCFSPMLLYGLRHRYQERRDRYFTETLGLVRSPLTGEWINPQSATEEVSLAD